MMAKYKYVEEFELEGSPKSIYPYLQNIGNLKEWFAAKIIVEKDNIINFMWDDQNHFARITHSQVNKYIRYEFLDDKKQIVVNDASYLEFRLSQSELTRATFLKITDYSEMVNENDLKALWEELIEQLRNVSGS
ncbi:MAG: ATPase [Bacteroidetes bacterium]|nr:MAG: ATPase [Bacteroidota bacterium]TAG89241.1 MAG: ATPase [Bacteroidota bacterium]